MTSLDILHQRLQNQHVTGTKLSQPEAVVQWLGAMQSQDYAGAKWSIGQRLQDGTDAVVEEAFNSGKILRTHVLRPTWHFVMPSDIRWMLALTAPHVHALNAYYYRKFELDEALFARSHALFTRALAGGNQLTRLELAALLEQEGIVAEKLRLAYIMMHAELEGLICSGAVRGKQHTYALLEERVPPAKTLTRDEALAELSRRFFSSHGPVTLKDYVAWSELPVADARAGLEMVKGELGHEAWDGQSYWFGASMQPVTQPSDAAYLLPEYDEALIAYKELALQDLPYSQKMDAWHDVWYRPILIAGRRAGTWRRTIAKKELVIEAKLFTALDAAQSQMLESAAQRYGEFLKLPATVAMV